MKNKFIKIRVPQFDKSDICKVREAHMKVFENFVAQSREVGLLEDSRINDKMENMKSDYDVWLVLQYGRPEHEKDCNCYDCKLIRDYNKPFGKPDIHPADCRCFQCFLEKQDLRIENKAEEERLQKVLNVIYPEVIK